MMRKSLLLAALGALLASPVMAQVGDFGTAADWNPDTINGAENTTHAEGSAELSGEDYILLGNGDDIWNDADEGYYIYNVLSGDDNVSIQARMAWFEPGADDWSKIGLMFRADPDDPSSVNYAVFLRGAGDGDFHSAQWRPTAGGASSSQNPLQDAFGVDLSGGALVKINRFGNTFATQYFDQGANTWVTINQQTIENFGADTGVGLAITSHTADDFLVEGIIEDVVIGNSEFLSVSRKLGSTLVGGNETFDVTLTVFNGSTTAQTVDIEEVLPLGWTASNASNSGTADGDSVTWSYEAPSGESTLSYTVTTPDNPSNEEGFELSSVNGVQPILGEQRAFVLFPLIEDNKIDAPALSNQVTLDGVLSDGEWDGAATFSFDTSEPNQAPGVVLGGADPGPNQSVTGHVFHDANYIWVALDVIDDNLDPYPWWEEALLPEDERPDGFDGNVWQWDSAELYLDGNLSRMVDSKEQNCLGAQMTVSADGRGVGGNDAPAVILSDDESWGFGDESTCWTYGARTNDEGYVVEYRLSKSSMLDPDDRTVVGFDVLMNGSDGGGKDDITREHKWGWFNTRQDTLAIIEAWDHEYAWGLLELTGEPVPVQDWTMF